ncbi:MAG: ATP-grasp domain-containing protein [Gammaproteobacteria bacterium]|nr:ATP-grasp domain-containing protein [Gammaproteobacteria bacterium]
MHQALSIPVVDVFVADVDANAAGTFMVPKSHRLKTPRVESSEAEYAEALLNLSLDKKIKLIFPLMDFELEVLSKWRELFEEKGIKVVVSDNLFINTTLNKDNFQIAMEKNGYCLPQHLNEGAHNISVDKDFILKKVRGSGSVGLREIHAKMGSNLIVDSGYIAQEKIFGQEYGLDILNDLEGNYLHCCLKRKISMRSGETDQATVIPVSPEVLALSRQISRDFRHVGNLDIDFIITDEGKIYLIDFNPRFGGGYAFTQAAGNNYLRAMVDCFLGRKPVFVEITKSVNAAKGVSVFGRENED